MDWIADQILKVFNSVPELFLAPRVANRQHWTTVQWTLGRFLDTQVERARSCLAASAVATFTGMMTCRPAGRECHHSRAVFAGSYCAVGWCDARTGRALLRHASLLGQSLADTHELRSKIEERSLQ